MPRVGEPQVVPLQTEQFSVVEQAVKALTINLKNA
jgi:hypothetical protein